MRIQGYLTFRLKTKDQPLRQLNSMLKKDDHFYGFHSSLNILHYDNRVSTDFWDDILK